MEQKKREAFRVSKVHAPPTTAMGSRDLANELLLRGQQTRESSTRVLPPTLSARTAPATHAAATPPPPARAAATVSARTAQAAATPSVPPAPVAAAGVGTSPALRSENLIALMLAATLLLLLRSTCARTA